MFSCESYKFLQKGYFKERFWKVTLALEEYPAVNLLTLFQPASDSTLFRRRKGYIDSTL